MTFEEEEREDADKEEENEEEEGEEERRRSMRKRRKRRDKQDEYDADKKEVRVSMCLWKWTPRILLTASIRCVYGSFSKRMCHWRYTQKGMKYD
jgi:hypothetical protein